MVSKSDSQACVLRPAAGEGSQGPADLSHSPLAGALLVAISAAAFGAMPLLGRAAYAAGADALGLLIVRFALAGALLTLVMRQRRIAWPRGRQCAVLVGMGAVGYVSQSASYFVAIQHAQTGLVALLLYLYPCFVTLLAAWWLGESLTVSRLAALALCVGGCALMVGGGHGQLLGIVLALAAALIYSLYIVVGARFARGVDPIATCAVVCLAATVTLAVAGMVGAACGAPPHFPHGVSGWAALVAIALVSTVAAMLAFFAGLQRLGAARTSMLSTLEPIVTVVLAALLLGESLSVAQCTGGALVLTAVLWLVRAR